MKETKCNCLECKNKFVSKTYLETHIKNYYGTKENHKNPEINQVEHDKNAHTETKKTLELLQIEYADCKNELMVVQEEKRD